MKVHKTFLGSTSYLRRGFSYQMTMQKNLSLLLFLSRALQEVGKQHYHQNFVIGLPETSREILKIYLLSIFRQIQIPANLFRMPLTWVGMKPNVSFFLSTKSLPNKSQKFLRQLSFGGAIRFSLRWSG